jgi:hypothetical protein
MTSEQWLALCKEAHGVKIAQDRENGVNVLMVDGLEVWRDWSSEPEDMVMSRDLADMVITIRRLAQERDEARAAVVRERDKLRAERRQLRARLVECLPFVGVCPLEPNRIQWMQLVRDLADDTLEEVRP